MSIQRVAGGWQVRWREAGRGSHQRAQKFPRKADAELFEAALKRRKALGELVLMEAGNRMVEELAREWWEKYATPNLALNTLRNYAAQFAHHVLPRLGRLRLRDVTPEAVAGFRSELERTGVGRDSTRVSMVVLQAMFRQAVVWRWVGDNPVKHVTKPSARRQTAVVCLAPSEVEAIRRVLLGRGKLYAATTVSLVAYQGLRVPEELLALEIRHVRKKRFSSSSATSTARLSPARRSGASIRVRSTWWNRCGATWPSTSCRWAGRTEGRCSSLDATASPGTGMTTRTGAGGCGIRRAARRGSNRCRPTTFAMPSRACRSGRACRSQSWPSRWAIARR